MEALAFPPLHCHRDEHEGVLAIMRDVRGMVEMYGKPFIKGFTTNPTLIMKAGPKKSRPRLTAVQEP